MRQEGTETPRLGGGGGGGGDMATRRGAGGGGNGSPGCSENTPPLSLKRDVGPQGGRWGGVSRGDGGDPSPVNGSLWQAARKEPL